MFDDAKEMNLSFEVMPDFNDLAVTIVQKRSGAESDLPGDTSEMFFPAESYKSRFVPRHDQPIVGLFRSRHILATIGDTRWDVRIRPSLTACLLEGDDRRSKHWWTIEGVPVDPKKEPTEADSLEFIRVTTELTERALPKLRKAYDAALTEFDNRERGNPRFTDTQLRVSLADSTEQNFLNLVDTLTLTSTTFSQALNPKKQGVVKAANSSATHGRGPVSVSLGAGNVTHFIRKTAGAVKTSRMKLETGKGGTAAVFAEAVPDKTAPEKVKRWAIAGLASSIGMVPSHLPTNPMWVSFAAAPDLARSVSAARPLSAWIADQGARQLEFIR